MMPKHRFRPITRYEDHQPPLAAERLPDPPRYGPVDGSDRLRLLAWAPEPSLAAWRCAFVMAALSWVWPVAAADPPAAQTLPDSQNIRTQAVHEIFARMGPALDEMYQDQLRDHPSEQGQFTLQLTVAPSGR